MKFLKTIAAAMLLLAPVAALSKEAPEGWTFVSTDDKGQTLYLRDEDWLKGRSHHTDARVWTRLETPQHEKFSAFMVYYKINCVTRQSMVLGGTMYLKDGSNERLRADRQPEYITPGTNMDTVRSYVCSDPRPAPTTPDWDA